MTNDYHFFLSFRWASTTRASSPHRLFPRFPRPITTSFRFRLRERRERLDFLDRRRRLRPRRRFFLVPLKWLERKNLPRLSLLTFAIYDCFCDAFQLRVKQNHIYLKTYIRCFIQQQMYYIGKDKLAQFQIPRGVTCHHCSLKRGNLDNHVATQGRRKA